MACSGYLRRRQVEPRSFTEDCVLTREPWLEAKMARLLGHQIAVTSLFKEPLSQQDQIVRQLIDQSHERRVRRQRNRYVRGGTLRAVYVKLLHAGPDSHVKCFYVGPYDHSPASAAECIERWIEWERRQYKETHV